MGARERKVENHFCARIHQKGGQCPKWKSPGNDGVPDRIVTLPGSVPFAVEVKTESGRLSSVQIRTISMLEEAGMRVYVVYGFKDVDELVDSL